MNDHECLFAKLVRDARAHPNETSGKSIYGHAVSEALKRMVWRAGDRGEFGMCWPYCFTELKTENVHLLLPLNRHKKPLGVNEYRWVDYGHYASEAWLFTSDPRELGDVWRKVGGGKYYLYDKMEMRGWTEALKYVCRLARVLEATGNNAVRYFASLT